jgi:hypothetical protein
MLCHTGLRHIKRLKVSLAQTNGITLQVENNHFGALASTIKADNIFLTHV